MKCCSEGGETYSLKHAGPGLGVPALDAAVELLTRVEDAVEVVLVVDGAGDAVAEHALGQAGQGVDGVLAQEGGGPARVPLGAGVRLRGAELVELVLCAGHGAVAIVPELVDGAPQQAARAGVQRGVRVRVVERDEEEGHVVLPGDAAERRQVRHGDQVAVAVLLVGHAQLAEVRLVVHVPPEHDAAEPEPVGRDREELLLGHQLAAQHPVHVDAGDLDGDIVLEQLGQRCDGHGLVGHGGGGAGGEREGSAVEAW